jgi:hypothetical protein
MTIKKAAVSYVSTRLRGNMSELDGKAKIDEVEFKKLLNKLTGNPDIGAAGSDALKAAYDAAKVKVGGNPTRADIRAQLDKAATTLSNERAASRINDGYVDAGEAASSKNPVVGKLYQFADASPAFTKFRVVKSGPDTSATVEQLERALSTLSPVIDAAAAMMKANPDRYQTFELAARDAARNARLSKEGRAALLSAVSGATPRNESGESASASAVKAVLSNGLTKLKGADGAQIVDFKTFVVTSQKDGVVTSTEVDRTPAVVGFTSEALLKFAATL